MYDVQVVLPMQGSPTLHFESDVLIDNDGTLHKLRLSSEDRKLLEDELVIRYDGGVSYRAGAFVTISQSSKTTVQGYIRYENGEFSVKERYSDMSLLKLWRIDRTVFWWRLRYRFDWFKVKGEVRYFLNRRFRYPAQRLITRIKGIPWWLERWREDEPPCPHCRGSGISYGDHLDMFAEYPCHYCGGEKKLRKCVCNPWGLYPIMGKRYRDREDCPDHCSDYKLPYHASVGWLRIKPKEVNMFENLVSLLGAPFSDGGKLAHYSISPNQMDSVLEILGLSRDDLNTSGGTAETLQVEIRGENQFVHIVGSPTVDTGHEPIWYATKEIPLQ